MSDGARFVTGSTVTVFSGGVYRSGCGYISPDGVRARRAERPRVAIEITRAEVM